MQNFSEQVASPIDGLTQNINIDLRTIRRHQTFREIIFTFRIFAKLKSLLSVFYDVTIEKIV